MFYLKQSTAAQIVLLGPFIDEDDGKTTEEALTINNTDIRISKNGANMEDKNSGGGTHDEAGWYAATFNATDTSAVGRLQVSVHVAGALPVWIEFQVLEEDIYDALIAASAAAFDANQRIDVGEWLGTAVTLSATSTKPEVDVNSVSDDAGAANSIEADYDGTGFNKSNSEIGTVAVNTDMRGTENAALASVLGALADVASDGDPTAVDTVMQYVKQLINVLVGTAGVVSYPASAAPGNGINLAEVLGEIFDDVTGLNGDAMRGTNSAALAANVPDVISLANINAEVDTALGDARLDEVVSATAGGVDAVVGSFLDLVMNADGGQTFAQVTDSLEAAANTVLALNDLAQSDILSDATPFPGASITEVRLAELAAANLPTDIANVQSDTDDIQTRLPAALVGGAMDSDVSNMQTDVVDANALDVDAVQEISRAINPQVNNAFNDITFEMYDSTTHNPSTGLTVSGERSLDGGAYAAVTGSITEISDGTYQLDASAADMNGALIAFRFFEGTADDTFVHVKTAA